ncbi:MAG: 4Fe-4S dicluster domain-containing protein [Pseudomonadota bacterium]
MVQRVNIEVTAPLCTSCRLCEISCSLYHEQLINMEKARIRVTDNYEQSLFEPHICRLCTPAPCVEACPSEALSQDDTGIIHVDDELCFGCDNCADACPYQAIWWREEQERILVCDRCGGNPTCIQFCTTSALRLA